jgi:hypothetical protein
MTHERTCGAGFAGSVVGRTVVVDVDVGGWQDLLEFLDDSADRKTFVIARQHDGNPEIAK